MRATLCTATLTAALLAAPQTTEAGPFGGFSADDTTYLVGRDTICTPIVIADTTSRAAPSCDAADQRAVAAGKFRKGKLQAGAKAKYTARARGTSLTISDRHAGKALVEWKTLDAFGRVLGVYVSEGGKLVAVEYEARVAGRVTQQVVGFALPRAAPAAEPDTPEPARPRAPAAKADPALAAAVAKARKQHKRSARRALAAWRAVLQLDADHAEARYGEAVQLVRLRKTDDALAALETLAKSTAADAVVWRVEARFDNAFRKLRGNKRFRAAVGLDAKSPASLYENLFGFSNTWEQHEIRCEQAEVRLTMKRLERTFKLRIRTTCGGFADTTRLNGKLTLHGQDEVRLVMPNKGKKDDVVVCRLRSCGDGSGEQCLQCMLDADLQFTLRVVRR